MPNISTMSAGIPNDYTAEALEIARRRKLAEALQAQSMTPIEQQSFGGIVAPISWTQGMAKMLQGYAAGKGLERAAEEEKTLAGKVKADRQAVLAEALKMAKGSDEEYPTLASLQSGAGAIIPAKAPDVQGAAAMLLGHGDPTLAALGGTLFTKTLEPKKYGNKPYYDQNNRAYVLDEGSPNPRFLPGISGRPEYTQVTTAGQSGAPQTEFVDKFNPPKQPLPQPVKSEYLNTGGSLVPRTGYETNPQPIEKTASPDTLVNARVTMRGQDLVNARSVDQNAIANQNKNVQITEGVRKEFNALPEVQNYKQVLPIIESVQRAPDTPAGDIDLIYGVGKIMDPNSVVREGELNLVIKAGSPAQKLQGLANYVKGGGRLAPAQRQQLLDVMKSRVGALKTNYDAARSSYDTILRSQNIDPAQVFQTLPDTGGFKVLGVEGQ